MTNTNFHDTLKINVHKFILGIYQVSASFPKEERYGVTSQLRRASVSIMLNYTEGYGRQTPNAKHNFYTISYGSLRESKYLLFLSKELGWLEEKKYEELFSLLDTTGGMLWSTMQRLEKEKAN